MHNTIGERLRQLMAERGLSAARLAKNAGVKPSFIYDIIHGKSTNPSIIKLARIANSMHISISALLDGEGQCFTPASNRHRGKRRLQLDTAPVDGYAAITGMLTEAAPDGKTSPYRFRQEWIRGQLGISPADLLMMTICEDSMASALCAGDTILIDITQKSPSPPGIFILSDGFGPVARRLEFIPNTSPPTIRIISDNPQYSAYERNTDELHIIGRVIWFAREL